MDVEARDHVPALTLLLSTVSLALVFGTALGAVPRNALPRAPAAVLTAIPHVNAAISLVAIPVIAHGWWRIRRGEVRLHRASMVAGVVLFGTFLAMYLYKVALVGPKPFPGPDGVYTLVYLPTLIVHMLLAVVCVPLLFYVLLLGVTHDVGELPRTRHPRVGRVAATLWLASFGLGFVVYLLLYVVY